LFRLRHLRSIDRKINESRYPILFYPEVYLLDGGYRSFYANHPSRCDGKYVEMRDNKHSKGGDDSIVEEQLDQSRSKWKRHKSTDFAQNINRDGSRSF
jgi:hypothetical protein